MTITYNRDVATSSFTTPFRLLSRWKGSVYKLIWKEFILYACIYASLSAWYRAAMTNYQKEKFEQIARYFEKFTELIPLSFILGFYVSLIIGRWWNQYSTIPQPTRLAINLIASLQSTSEKARIMRRTIMRYAGLCHCLTMASISPPVFKRFPTLEHVETAGLLINREKEILENIKTPYNKYFVPIVWSTGILTKARKENYIKDDVALKTILDEMNNFRSKCGLLLEYDQINIPLVYTQVVTISVYTFFFSCLMGRQLVPGAIEGKPIFDPYVPIFTLLQFLFYMGWLKIAEELINPFGEDDDDFNINALIDKNLQISYLIVDEMQLDYPVLTKDAFWDTVEFDLPYTESSKQYQTEVIVGTAVDIKHLKDNNNTKPSFLKKQIGELESDDGKNNDENTKNEITPSSDGKSSNNVGNLSIQLFAIEKFKNKVKIPKLKYRQQAKGLPFISTSQNDKKNIPSNSFVVNMLPDLKNKENDNCGRECNSKEVFVENFNDDIIETNFSDNEVEGKF